MSKFDCSGRRMSSPLCGSICAKEIRLVLRINGDNMSLEGLRRALYNFLFARTNNGKFVLQLGLNKHGKQPRAKKIEALLDRFGLYLDEGPGTGGPFAPYSVVKRLKTYTDVVERLIDIGVAYRCFCCDNTLRGEDPAMKDVPRLQSCSGKCPERPRNESRSMAADGLPHSVRYRTPARTYLYRDVVLGQLPRPVKAMDQLLLRPNFLPTSFFSNVVDNHTLCATHYVASSSYDFLQLPLYDLLKWVPPIFLNIGSLRLRSGAHLLSYNNARSYVRTYSSVPEASILNFLLAGRGLQTIKNSSSSHLYSIDEMIERFDVNIIPCSTLSLNTYKLMKPERQEILQKEKQLELDNAHLDDFLDQNFFEDMDFSGSAKDTP